VRFLILPHVAQVWGLRVRCQALQENGSFLFECLPSLFVPSLSWQKDIIIFPLKTENGAKSTGFFLPVGAAQQSRSARRQPSASS
jgi:hypothetical protein